MLYNIRLQTGTMQRRKKADFTSAVCRACFLPCVVSIKASHNEANERCKPLCVIVYPVTCIA